MPPSARGALTALIRRHGAWLMAAGAGLGILPPLGDVLVTLSSRKDC